MGMSMGRSSSGRKAREYLSLGLTVDRGGLRLLFPHCLCLLHYHPTRPPHPTFLSVPTDSCNHSSTTHHHRCSRHTRQQPPPLSPLLLPEPIINNRLRGDSISRVSTDSSAHPQLSWSKSTEGSNVDIERMTTSAMSHLTLSLRGYRVLIGSRLVFWVLRLSTTPIPRRMSRNRMVLLPLHSPLIRRRPHRYQHLLHLLPRSNKGPRPARSAIRVRYG